MTDERACSLGFDAAAGVVEFLREEAEADGADFAEAVRFAWLALSDHLLSMQGETPQTLSAALHLLEPAYDA